MATENTSVCSFYPNCLKTGDKLVITSSVTKDTPLHFANKYHMQIYTS